MKDGNRAKKPNDKKPGNAGFRTPSVFKFQKSDQKFMAHNKKGIKNNNFRRKNLG